MSSRTWAISALSSLVSGSVWTMMPSRPEVVTTGDEALSTPLLATASRTSSAVSWVTWSAGMLTLYSAPPVNSMPQLRPLK